MVIDDEREGLRERKRRQTRERIAEAGFRLFLERGFEKTTVDAIAEAADIARRTFFHYFDSKEAILFSIQDRAEEDLRATILEATLDRTPFAVVCDAMMAMVSSYDPDEARAIDGLLRSTAVLRARKQAHYVRQERMIFATLQEKWPETESRQKLRLVSLVCVGAMRLAAEAWNDEADSRSLQDHLARIFAALRCNITS